MAISFRKYIDITSGVGGNAVVRRRDLIGRLFTSNPLLPPASFIEFTDPESVGAYFGTSSAEYLRAAFYFSWISKLITRAKKISFARWVDAAVAPRIYGVKGDQTLVSWTSITAGAFTLQIGADTHLINALNFASAASLSDVAQVIETKINAQTGTMWTAAVVSWDPVRKSFNFVGGSTVDATISVTAGTGGADVAEQLGWLTGAILADGAIAETVTETLIASAQASNNFASFLFMPDLSQDEVEETAAWNKTQNVMYMYCQSVSAADAQDYYDALAPIGGVGVILEGEADEYPEMFPMIIFAATDYTKRNSVQNYMFQQFALTPSVVDTQVSNDLDAIRINYYGRTQTAGQFLDFTQRGVMMGLPTDPVDMNVYANEVWLKDAAAASFMELLLSLARVSANKRGSAQLMTQLQSVIDEALFNGTISVGKPLTTTQKLYITEMTGDELAWFQVQNAGYWRACVMTPVVTTDGRTEWVAKYTLIYSKDDAIRKVEGTHVLI